MNTLEEMYKNHPFMVGSFEQMTTWIGTDPKTIETLLPEVIETLQLFQDFDIIESRRRHIYLPNDAEPNNPIDGKDFTWWVRKPRSDTGLSIDHYLGEGTSVQEAAFSALMCMWETATRRGCTPASKLLPEFQ